MWSKQLYKGVNFDLWIVEGSEQIYSVTRVNQDWLCSCSIVYKGNPKRRCKHIKHIMEKVQ